MCPNYHPIRGLRENSKRKLIYLKELSSNQGAAGFIELSLGHCGTPKLGILFVVRRLAHCWCIAARGGVDFHPESARRIADSRARRRVLRSNSGVRGMQLRSLQRGKWNVTNTIWQMQKCVRLLAYAAPAPVCFKVFSSSHFHIKNSSRSQSHRDTVQYDWRLSLEFLHTGHNSDT